MSSCLASSHVFPLQWSSLSLHILQTQSSHLLTTFHFSHIGLKVLSGSQTVFYSFPLVRIGQFGWELKVRLLFRISCSLSGTPISFLLVSFGQFGRERFGLKVLSGTEPPSWSLLGFRREQDFEFPSSVYDFLFLISRPLAWLCLSLEVHSGSEPPSWSLLRFCE